METPGYRERNGRVYKVDELLPVTKLSLFLLTKCRRYILPSPPPALVFEVLQYLAYASRRIPAGPFASSVKDAFAAIPAPPKLGQVGQDR